MIRLDFSWKLAYYYNMPIVGIIECILFIMWKPVVVDSVIYVVDSEKFEVQELKLKEDIFDYAIDDFLYILTNRYLYKIDYQTFFLVDRTPLPQRFNSFSLDDENIMLITANEIILVDRSNFTFKAGIGIEQGDYQPLISSVGFNISTGNHYIYLISHAEKSSVIKIFDVTNGRLIKKIHVRRVMSLDYDTRDGTFTILDCDGRLTTYDIDLNKKRSIILEIEGQSFRVHADGYLVYNRQGVFLINTQGRLIDFQPFVTVGSVTGGNSLFLAEAGLVYLDTLTLRVKRFSQYRCEMRGVYRIRYLDEYALAIDGNDDVYFIDVNSLHSEPALMKSILLKENFPLRPMADSLWYVQMGAYADYNNALEKYHDITQRRIPVFIDSTDLYRIKLGGFYDKNTAMELIAEIDLNGWLVIQKKIERKGKVEFFAGSERYIFEDGIIRKE